MVPGPKQVEHWFPRTVGSRAARARKKTSVACSRPCPGPAGCGGPGRRRGPQPSRGGILPPRASQVRLRSPGRGRPSAGRGRAARRPSRPGRRRARPWRPRPAPPRGAGPRSRPGTSREVRLRRGEGLRLSLRRYGLRAPRRDLPGRLHARLPLPGPLHPRRVPRRAWLKVLSSNPTCCVQHASSKLKLGAWDSRPSPSRPSPRSGRPAHRPGRAPSENSASQADFRPKFRARSRCTC
jgi:hypothetical protein